MKFRGKRRDNNEWVYGYVCNCDIIPIDKYIESNFGWLEEQKCYSCKKETIGQFTGIKDKNEKEIYEGDIIKAKTYYYGKEKEIVYKVDFNIKHNSLGTIGYYFQGFSYEVIGNIYDNPELINKYNLLLKK